MFGKYKFNLKGQTPLLMHADDVERSSMLEEYRKDPERKKLSKAGDDRSPAWTWHTYLYSDGTHIVIPAENLLVSMRQAGSMVTLGGKKTMKGSAMSGLIFDKDFYPLLVDGKPLLSKTIDKLRDLDFEEQREAARKLGFELHVKRLTIGGKSKHVRVRPMFSNWGIEGTVEAVLPEVTADRVRDLFKYAGIYKGLCDGRPGGRTPGRYGMFSVDIEKAK